MKIVLIVLAVFVLLLLIGWLGLRVQPKPFATIAQQSAALQTAPLPDGLPAPVERFYRQLYGDRIPLIQSAVISGRAVMSPVGGLKIPATGAVTWFDQGKPWAEFTVEDVVFNTDVSEMLRKGSRQ